MARRKTLKTKDKKSKLDLQGKKSKRKRLREEAVSKPKKRRSRKRERVLALAEWEAEQQELAKEERKKRKKTGKKIAWPKRIAPVDGSYAWKTKHLRNGTGELVFWPLEHTPEERPKARRLANKDRSPEDWIWNPETPKLADSNIERRQAFASALRRVTGPRLHLVARAEEENGDKDSGSKEYMLCSAQQGMIYFSSFEAALKHAPKGYSRITKRGDVPPTEPWSWLVKKYKKAGKWKRKVLDNSDGHLDKTLKKSR